METTVRKTKPTANDAIIIREDNASQTHLNEITERVRCVNDSLSKIQEKRKIKFDDSTIAEFLNGTLNAHTTAKLFYTNEIPEIMEILQNGLEKVLNEIKAEFHYFTTNFFPVSLRTKSEFARVINGKIEPIPNVKQELKEMFELKISGENLAQYKRAKVIKEQINNLIQDTNLQFNEMFALNYNQDYLEILDENFCDYTKRKQF